jgi:hypothetical protein
MAKKTRRSATVDQRKAAERAVDRGIAQGRADNAAGRYVEFRTAEEGIAFLDAVVAKDRKRPARLRSAMKKPSKGKVAR